VPGPRSAPTAGSPPTAGPPAAATGRLGPWRRAAAGTHLAVSLAAGVLAGGASGPALGWGTAGLLAWVGTAAVFLAGTWLSVWRLDATDTAWLAAREDGSRAVRDLALVGISLGTVVTVALVIFRVHQNPPERTALAVACVAASWLVLNTVYTLRYARLYYMQPQGGVDFAGGAAPVYRDFAYLGFTIGMTFQVSDTALQTTDIRVTVLRHALMAFVFDVVIIAVTLNVVAGLSY
jgi:uncharacterized membrane protein